MERDTAHTCRTSGVTVSIIIPVRDTDQEPPCAASIGRSLYPQELVEVLIVCGSNPSAQRNAAASQAAGEILYFLDDDSVLDSRTLQTLVFAFSDHPEAAVVGGPSIGFFQGGSFQGDSSSDSLFQKCSAMAMGSLFGFGPLRHRFYPSGLPRFVSEDELILSNLAVRRSVWQTSGGFDTRLYPNEENEFLRRLEAQGQRCFYHPSVIVHRPMRRSLAGLAYQVFRYGAGRAKHLRLRAHPLNAALFCPLLFCLYLLAFFGAIIAVSRPMLLFSSSLSLPLKLYCFLALCAALFAALAVKRRRVATFFWHVLIYPIIHLGYGMGMIIGFLQPAQEKAEEFSLRLQRTKSLDRAECENALWTDVLWKAGDRSIP
jgi:cellulose synthase/poly-beta-1,6-N-acetylglucosamine synthase-like glycosyltransferase